MEQNEKTFFEVRKGIATLARFNTWNEANKFAKNEIKECEYDGHLDIYQMREISVESIRKIS